MPGNLRLDAKLVQQAVRLGNFKTEGDAINLRILELEGQIDFDPNGNYKRIRGAR